MQLSVVIPAHNPDFSRLCRTLEGLRRQSLPTTTWETLIVDNASEQAIRRESFVACAPPNLRIVREPQLGLTPARLRGFAETTGRIVVLVDDDNVLAPDYLAQALTLADEHPRLGAWSGNVLLRFEPGAVPPPSEWRSYLTERNVSTDAVSREIDHHDSTPWGAGLCVRREVCTAYAAELARNPLRRQLDLQGDALLYGGDTDISYVACAAGFTKGVFPRLTLDHLIPAYRCQTGYLLRSIEGHAYSGVLHGFILHHSIPPYVTDPVWRTKSWLRRLFLSGNARREAAAIARGRARAVQTIRRLPPTV